MKKRNFGSSRILWPGFLFYLLSGILFLMLSKKKSRPIEMTTTKLNKDAQDLYFLLTKKGFNFQQARYIVAQAGHETADFTSQIYKENHNPFGMKFAHVRKTTALGEKYGHARYSSVESAVDDFKFYWDNWRYLSVYSSMEAYITAIKNNKYFEAPYLLYLAACKKFYKLYFNV
jgi:hypothetical protein